MTKEKDSCQKCEATKRSNSKGWKQIEIDDNNYFWLCVKCVKAIAKNAKPLEGGIQTSGEANDVKDGKVITPVCKICAKLVRGGSFRTQGTPLYCQEHYRKHGIPSL